MSGLISEFAGYELQEILGVFAAVFKPRVTCGAVAHHLIGLDRCAVLYQSAMDVVRIDGDEYSSIGQPGKNLRVIGIAPCLMSYRSKQNIMTQRSARQLFLRGY